jgi:hypothetical protein
VNEWATRYPWALADELDEMGPDNESRERWYWSLVAGLKLFVRVDFPAMWREIYLERGRYGMTREWIEKMSASKRIDE